MALSGASPAPGPVLAILSVNKCKNAVDFSGFSPKLNFKCKNAVDSSQNRSESNFWMNLTAFLHLIFLNYFFSGKSNAFLHFAYKFFEFEELTPE
ncbi:hypothetical protein [Paenibacillus protaetiae]|uniref:Uncharacterized protein n=1 Tax=Paenibacillus protaetiae TaxID=2509456 RepID=A0A4P6F265_9BACL|nr:hypothetical protein [Paenibacillus protaetiae]QAY67157.1 hypothetical protein ET464_12875 [Paenibacillus protaetiae]